MELSSLIDIKKRPSQSTQAPSNKSHAKDPKDKDTDKGKDKDKTKKISLSPKMKRRSKKKVAVAKDIFQIEKTIQRKSNEAAAKVAAEKAKEKENAKEKAVESTNSQDQRSQEKSRNRKSHGKSHGKSHKKRSVRKRSRSKRNMRKGRQIKVKSSNVSEKDIESIQKHINEIRNQSSQDIKEDLRKKGIRVSGKSDRLLKDIYFYSKVCNLNIVHEK